MHVVVLTALPAEVRPFHTSLNLKTNPATRTLNAKNPFQYSWRVGFSYASVVRLPAEFSGVWLGFTAPVTEEGGRVQCSRWRHATIFKHAVMRSKSQEDWSGWIEQCVVYSSPSHVVDEGASTPSKEWDHFDWREAVKDPHCLSYLHIFGGLPEQRLLAVEANSFGVLCFWSVIWCTVVYMTEENNILN